MITIRSAGSQQASVLNSGYWAGSAGTSTLSPYFQHNCPLPGVICPDYGTELSEAYSYEIPFGFLSQGRRPWGKLLDKDVLHIDAKGEVNFDWLAQSTSEIWGTLPITGNQWYFGDHFLVGTSNYFYGHLFRWGETATVERTYNLPTGGSGTHGAAVSGTVTWSYTCATHGDYLYLGMAKLYSTPWTFADGFSCSYGYLASPSAQKCRLYRRVKDSGSNTWKFYYKELTASGSVNGVPRVKLPNGVISPWNEVPFDAALWTTWCVTAHNGVPHDSLCYGTYDEFSNQRFALEERINLLLLDKAAQVFLDNPSSKTTADLTTDIIAQHKIMDTMMLVTVVQLASARLDSVPWRNLKNILETGMAAVKQGRTTVKALISAIKQISKDGSGTYLGTIYGVLPTWSDIGIAWNAADTAAKLRMKPSRLHARTITYETPVQGSLLTRLTLTADVDNIPKDFLAPPMRTIRNIWALGFWPTFEMAWDCVPFSFVLNWFVQINAAVEDLDTQVWVKYFPVWYTISSEKREWTVSLKDLWPDLDLPENSVLITRYHRWCENELPLPPIRLGDEPTGQFNHWAEATALVVQKLF